MKAYICHKCRWLHVNRVARCNACGFPITFLYDVPFSDIKHQPDWYGKQIGKGVSEEDLQKILDDWQLELLL